MTGSQAVTIGSSKLERFDSSVDKTLGAPSFVRSLHKGWDTADAHLDRKHSA